MDINRKRFFWQTALIVLPMVALAGYALWTLQGERLRLEARWRQQATERLAQLTPWVTSEWERYVKDTRHWMPEVVFREGRLVSPLLYEDAPTPVVTSTAIRAMERAVFEKLASSDLSAMDAIRQVSEALELSFEDEQRLLLLGVPFISERHGPDKAMEVLEQLATLSETVYTPSGLPIQVVAAARRHDLTGASSLESVRALRRLVMERPSALTPALLQVTESLVGGEEAERDWQQWQEDERDRQLAQCLLEDGAWEHGRLLVIEPTLWRAFTIGKPEEPFRIEMMGLDGSPVEMAFVDFSESSSQVYLHVSEDAAEKRVRALSAKDFESFAVQIERHVAPPLASEKVALSIRDWGGDERALIHQPYDQDPLAMAEIGPFRVRAWVHDPIVMENTLRERRTMTHAMVLGALTVAMLGIFVQERGFRRERALHQMKSDFVSSVSHELRTPIASVSLMTDSLKEGRVSEREKRERYYELMGQECRRLGRLIENVLDTSRIEQGRKAYVFEETAIVSLVEDTVALMRPAADEKGVSLWWKAVDGADEWEPSIDAEAVRQALVNLIDNAIKHAPAKSVVAVEIGGSLERETLDLAVSDSGPGIPRREQKRIFEPFYRVGSEWTRQTIGSGIGLHIVKHIAEGHGGTVQVTSTPGLGSRFEIQLPMDHD